MFISRRNLAGGLLLAMLLVGACGDDDAADVADGVIEITGIDYGYEGVPEQIRAGSSIRLINASEVEVHEIVAVRLDDAENRPVSELAGVPPEELGSLLDGLQTVVVAPPVDSGFVVEGDGTLSQPGRYAFFCLIPTGADPEEYLAAAAEAAGGPPQVDGGPPHLVAGMYAEVDVVE
ncbi:MAG: hypothetical protein AAGD18_09250 [Actinomycetota bacterium]